MRNILAATLVLFDSEVLKGAAEVLQGAGLPTSGHAFGELLGWVLLALAGRLVLWAKGRFAPSVAVTNVVAPVVPVAGTPVLPALPASSTPPVEQPEGSV